MYCWFLQRKSGARHIVKIQQKALSILKVDCNSRLLFLFFFGGG